MKKWKTLSSKIAFDNPYLKVRNDIVELPNGKKIEFLTWVEKEVVFIFPITKDNKVILVRQYKQGARKVVIEFPAGYIDDDEMPEIAAKRELLEETGHDSGKLAKLCESFPNPTKIASTYHFFLAEKCFIPPTNSSHQDETENIEILLKSPYEVYEMLINNEINSSASLVTGFMGLQKLNKFEYKS